MKFPNDPEEIMRWIDRELDGESSETESRALREFLAANPDWRKYMESLGRLEKAAREAPLIHPSPGFANRVMERVIADSAARKTQSASPRRNFRLARFSMARLALAASLAAAVALPWLTPGHSGSTMENATPEASAAAAASAALTAEGALSALEAAGEAAASWVEIPLGWMESSQVAAAGTAGTLIAAFCVFALLLAFDRMQTSGPKPRML